MEEGASQYQNSNIPTVLVIFGATGDLMHKKLVPALFHLFKKGKLPDRFKIIGYARRPLSTEEFRRQIAVLMREHNVSEAEYQPYLELYSYVQGNFEQSGDYQNLSVALDELDRFLGICTSKLFYLAVSPALYQTIFLHLSNSGLTRPCSAEEGWTRVLVEKPFGTDSDTAQKLDQLLGRLFKEIQIYRIDHYLAKEMLQNILAFRFSNNFFENNWSADSIDRIDIKLWERIGAEDPGAFYDGIGALRDVGQNHLLQMLALITMELPNGFSAEAVRQRRSDVLKTLAIQSHTEVADRSIRAQYGGYTAIPGVTPGSKTETYFKIRTELTSPRWQGVPVILEAGKRMGKNLKEIVVTFRHPQPCMCPQGTHYQNKVYFTLEPEERITIRFWAKKPGLELEMEERAFDFLLRDPQKKTQYVEEYEKLLLDCITGDQTLFVSTEEVSEMWRFTDPIVHAWRKNIVPLKIYQPDTHEFAVAEIPSGKEKKDGKENHIGYIGLGKMGKNQVALLVERGWNVHCFDINAAALAEAARVGAKTYARVEDMVAAVESSRIIWVMVAPASAIDEVFFGKSGLIHLLKKGDMVIDGGNSLFEDSIKRAKKFERAGIRFLDVGVSNGPEGARHGAVLFIGGARSVFDEAEPLFQDLALRGAYDYMGPTGAGHFVKMVHNGIEYGMMQSVAEGFAVLKKSRYQIYLTVAADLYNNGSIIESRLVEWLKKAYKEYGEDLKKVSGKAELTGEGEWTVKIAKKLKVPTPAIKAAVDFRLSSGRHPSYIGKIISALRNQFGGHSIK